MSRPELTLLTQPREQRRTIVITGQRPEPRRRAPAEHVSANPDRIAMWAFVFGIFLVLVAMATG